MVKRALEQELQVRDQHVVIQPPPKRISATALGISIPVKQEPRLLTKKVLYTIIETGLLIPGDGEPIEDAALVIENKLIAWVGTASDVPAKYRDSPHKSYKTPYLMPGLWDCHVHLFGGGEGDKGTNNVSIMLIHPTKAGARLAKRCWEALQRGYTSLREVGGLGCEVGQTIDEGAVVGPNIYSAGAVLSQTAGHGDLFSLPAGDVLLNMGISNITAGQFGSTFGVAIADGVDECRRAVRLQLRRGARCVKFVASGGIGSRDDNPLYAQYSAEELECIVSEATRQHRAVAAHVHGKPGILAAIEAGVTSIEHGTFADQECIDLMKEKGIVLVATRNIFELLLDTGGKGLSEETWSKVKACAGPHLEMFKNAVKNGVTMALGTDTEPGFNMAKELEYAVKAGMTNLEAIKAATANGPLTVRGQAPKTGQLKVGYEADILGILESPVDDVKVLQDQDNIKWVWKGGKLFKGPGVGPWGEEN